jgi:PadR family transcriptional regulator, regulatory protein PadR
MQDQQHSQNQRGPEDPQSHPHQRRLHRFDGHDPESSPEGRRSHHEHHHGERNFWSEWRDERHHHGRGEDILVGQALSPKEMEAWREFFNLTFGTWPEEHWIFGGRRFSPWHQGMDTFNPFVATLLSKGGGLLPLYVLHLISQKPRYGNEIMDMLAERTNGQWVANPGAIYPLLTLLEKENFIEGKWEDPDKRTIRVYTITPKGQVEVTRIEMIVMPKLKETVQVLQELISNLQSESASDQSPALDATEETDNQAGSPQDEQGKELL